jgi:glucose-1-phosphate adenylyltransferase
MDSLITFVLGGGRGTRLFPLTRYRAKPAVPLAGKYRLIDIPLSNCINSGMTQIYVLTQFLSVSLHRHIRETYHFDPFSRGFVELLAAQQTMEAGTDWYEGTADAVRKNLRYLEQPGIEYVLILSGDQLYRMDYREMLATHVQAGADATIAALPVSRAAASEFGVMRVDDSGRVVGFLEKPQSAEELEIVATDPAWIDARGIQSNGRGWLASMGIYLFNLETLMAVLKKTTYRDFGREIFPASIRTRHVQVHLFDGYWEDIGTIRAFYEANLAMTLDDPPFPLNTPDSPIYTRARFLPPAQITDASIRQSMIADGCRVGPGTTIENSIVGLRCQIGSNVTIRNSILMGIDAYPSIEDRRRDKCEGRPPMAVGDSSVISGAIVDKDCRIGRNVRIENTRSFGEAELSSECWIRDNIPVVAKGALVPDGTTVG